MPVAGRVDVVVASELVEAARAMELGFVSDRITTLIASTSRVYTAAEKIDMGDGRFDGDRIEAAARKMAKVAVLADLDRIARENGTFISATLFAALDASGALPWGREVSEAAIGADGKGAASLAGFRAALAAVEGGESEAEPGAVTPVEGLAHLPEGLRALVALGRSRMVEYQDEDYAALYLARVEALVAAADAGDRARELGRVPEPGLSLLLGLDAARRRARDLVESACAALDPYGKRAESLREAARFVIAREH